MLNENLRNHCSPWGFCFRSSSPKEVMDHPMWGESAAGAPTTVDFAVSILDDWAIVTIVLGILLSMAMIGASYLVRDERLVNLLYDMGGDE